MTRRQPRMSAAFDRAIQAAREREQREKQEAQEAADNALRREGAAQMRERCARFVERFDARIANIDERDAVLADNIRELPLTEQDK